MISERQVWVGVVSKGCDNVVLNSSYANRYVNMFVQKIKEL